MKLVEITKEQVNALDYVLQSNNEDKVKVILEFYGKDGSNYRGYKDDDLKCLNDLTYEEFTNAVIHGYIEIKTPEQKIKNLYQYYLSESFSGDYDREPGGRIGIEVIKDMLEILKMEVEGVNK